MSNKVCIDRKVAILIVDMLLSSRTEVHGCDDFYLLSIADEDIRNALEETLEWDSPQMHWYEEAGGQAARFISEEVGHDGERVPGGGGHLRGWLAIQLHHAIKGEEQ